MIPPDAPQVDIEVAKLSVTYETSDRRVQALDRVSFSVERGHMCCIVGPSGCGKSTLLRAMLGLVETSSGSVAIDPVRHGKGIAFVQQDAPLLPWRTSLQNACLGEEIRGKVDRRVVDRVVRSLTDLGLHGFEDSLTSELSGGMRQRVAIVRALERDPALLFCDEPFAAVDFVGRLSLTSLFKRMTRVSGITTLFVTHNIEEAIFLGDVVLVMSGRPGRIKSSYTPQESIGNGDAVASRSQPQFGEFFQRIWEDLKS